MGETPESSGVLGFSAFRADLRAGELHSNGQKVVLQEQPFRVLALLLQKPGEVVTREELREKLWPADTFVDFDRSLNTTVNKLRRALGDSADHPQFVETVPKRGYRFIARVNGAGAEALEGLSDFPDQSTLARTGPLSARDFWRSQRFPQAALVGLSVLVLAGIILGSWLRAPESEPELSLRRFSFAPEDLFLEPVISPDGRHIAYVTGQYTLWVQDLDRDEPRQVVRAGSIRYPFWSPDSNFIGFRAAGALKKVSVQGGPTTTLCEMPRSTFLGAIMSGAWSSDGNTIVFCAGSPQRLYEVSSQGGTPKLLFPEESEQQQSHGSPHFLPKGAGSRGLLFVIREQQEDRLVLQNLDSGAREVLARGDRPFYSPTGHIVYQTAAGLWALPFSAETLTMTGEPFPIKENASYLSVAGDGTLLYRGSKQTGLKQLVWRDRRGEKLAVIGRPQQDIQMPALSPDGSRVVVRALENDNWDIWIHDFARPLKTRLSFDPANADRPTWMAKGDKVTFSSSRNGNWDIFVKSADGSGEAEPLLATPSNEWGYGWSSDGKYLVGSGDGRIWYLEAKEGASGYEVAPFIETPFDELSPDLSPDRRFLAYESDESGQYEIYVRPFPNGGQGGVKWQVSTNSGRQPRWRGDGKELFYVEGDTLVAVSVTTKPSFSIGATRRLFDAQDAFDGRGQQYDVSADGQRFVMVETLDEHPATVIRVVQNWYEEFRDREQD